MDIEEELENIKRDIQKTRAILQGAEERSDHSQVSSAMSYLASLYDEKKRIEARLAPPPTVLSSPRYESSVFVLCDSVARGQMPVGTCFSISLTHVLTCYHNLLEDINGNPERIYTIALSVERDKKQDKLLFPEGFLEVKLKYRNKNADWAILEVQGNVLLQEFIPISVNTVTGDTHVKIFHCPVSLFNSQEEDILSAGTVRAKTLRGTAHHLRCNIGFFRGSSGAPVVLLDGCVVAFHQESFSEARSLPAGQDLAQMATDDAWDIVSDVVNSIVSTHSPTSAAVQISKCPRLVQKLQQLAIIS